MGKNFLKEEKISYLYCIVFYHFLTSSVFAATVVGVSVRLEKLVLLPCLLLLLKQSTSVISPAAILVILSFSMHCDSGIPNTNPPATSVSNKVDKNFRNLYNFFRILIYKVISDLCDKLKEIGFKEIRFHQIE